MFPLILSREMSNSIGCSLWVSTVWIIFRWRQRLSLSWTIFLFNPKGFRFFDGFVRWYQLELLNPNLGMKYHNFYLKNKRRKTKEVKNLKVYILRKGVKIQTSKTILFRLLKSALKSVMPLTKTSIASDKEKQLRKQQWHNGVNRSFFLFQL